MKILTKMKACILMAALALAVIFTGNVAEAKTVKNTYKRIEYLGETMTLDRVTSVKINKKSLSKMKKKVKSVKTYSDQDGFSYYAKDWTYDTQDSAMKYKSLSDYELTFLKTGTYTITTTSYSSTSGGYYYDSNYNYHHRKDELTKYVTTYKIKVLKTDAVVKSVQLGKAKQSYTDKRGKTGSDSYTNTKKVFLSGSKGKLTVKMADKNYQIQSIVVATYDKDGDRIYTAVKNKKSVTFGNFKDEYKYDSYGYYSHSSSLYKPTEVYISYKDKFTGTYTKWSVKKDAYGKSTLVEVKDKDSYGDTTSTYTTSYIGGSNCQSYTFYKK